MKIRTTVKIKKWRNSFRIILPEKVVNKMNIKENQEIDIEIVKIRPKPIELKLLIKN